MGEWKPASWYDDVYESSPLYQMEFDVSPWRNIWSWVVRKIRSHDVVCEIGCGPGHLAEALQGRIDWYIGLDFSEVAIEQARERCCEIGFLFAEWDVERISWLPTEFSVTARVLSPKAKVATNDKHFELMPNVYVFVETLEHLKDDLAVLRKVPPDCRVLFTVPTYDDDSHVRFFPTRNDAVDYYIGTTPRIFRPKEWGVTPVERPSVGGGRAQTVWCVEAVTMP